MEVIGDYEYNKKDLIGHGAFAVVFKGRSRKKGTTVAIKSITKKNLAKSQNLLSKEIKILKELSDLHHENVVALLDCKETTNHVYLVMEYCNGGDLADYLQAKGTLSEATISMFLRQIAFAMKALHGKGIVHRDLKPQNILLTNAHGKVNVPASEIVLKIADFGFARFLNDGVMAATLCGSPMYMAPEVIMSLQYDAKADLWSIGTIVFQCLTGKAPFQAQTPQQLKHFYEKHSELKPNIPKDTSSELRDLLLRMLKRNAKDRIAFKDFFIHPFLKPPSPVKTSSPVPVPRRTSQGFSSESPTPPRCVSASPLSGTVEYSPPPPPPSPSPKSKSPKSPRQKMKTVKSQEVEPMQGSSQEGDFLKVGKDAQPATPGKNSPTEDFVMVPAGLPSDIPVTKERVTKAPLAQEEDDFKICGETPPKSLNTVNVSPTSAVALFSKNSPEEQTSPNRPSTLPMQTEAPKANPYTQTSQPIPVPSQVKAYKRMQECSPSSPRKNSMEVSPVSSAKDMAVEKKDTKLSPHSADSKFVGPDIGSMSPPSVKFTIGTPPAPVGPWKRNSIGSTPGRCNNTPPNVTSSPLKRSGNSSPNFQVQPASLPAIIGSPPKFPGIASEGKNSPDSLAMEPVSAAFVSTRPHTIPDNMATIPYKGAATVNVNTARRNLMDNGFGRANTEPNVFGKVSGGSLLSEQLVRAAFGTPQQPFNNQGAVVPYGSGWRGSKEKITSPVAEKIGSFENEKSPSLFRRGSEASPPAPVMFAQSPPNMEGPVAFTAPELAEETLMDDKHNETMAKLSFVLDLVDCIVELAQSRGTPLHGFNDSISVKQGDQYPSDQVPKFTEAQRRIEQLVLYIRSLHLLSSSLQLARTEIKEERLQISNSLRNVLKQMNESYHKCVNMCRQIQNRLGSAVQTSLTPQIAVATADKLIYNYAIEMCQTAALDELFGNPNECFRRYQTAHLLLHSLSQQARNTRDKLLLNKYKDAVERRLANIHVHTTSQPYAPAMETAS